jgi:hypothetical protein
MDEVTSATCRQPIAADRRKPGIGLPGALYRVMNCGDPGEVIFTGNPFTLGIKRFIRTDLGRANQPGDGAPRARIFTCSPNLLNPFVDV